MLSKTKEIVACTLQEAGSYPTSPLEKVFTDFKGFGGKWVGAYVQKLDTSRYMVTYHCPWAKSDDGNLRCSLAFVLIGDFKNAELPRPELVATGQAARPMLGMVLDGVALFTLHANSSQNASLSAKSLIGELIGKYNTWIVAGDYNCKQTEMTGDWYVRQPAASGVRLDQNFVQLASQDIDYAIQTKRAQGNAVRLSQHPGVLVGSGMLKSDHPATAFQIQTTKGQT